MALKLQDFIDIKQFQMLQDRLNEIYSFPSAIIDNEGNVLTATAWQDVCTKFHRTNKESERECIKSDQYIIDHLHEAHPAVTYRCPHGFVDNATPIVIDGVHYGNFFTGQFLLEPPDLDFFRAQAKKFGFDEEAYIAAVKRVPVWTGEQLKSYLFFIKGLIEVIAGIGQKNLSESEARKQIRQSEERSLAILQTAMEGFWRVDSQGRLKAVNDAYCRMSGYSAAELLTMRIPDLEAVEDLEITAGHIRKIMEQGEDRFESRHRRKDGSVFDVEISVQYRAAEGGELVAFLRDITERKRAEEELKKSALLLESSIESQKDTILFAIDSNYRYLFFNKAHLDVMKSAYNTDIKVGMNILECISSNDDRKAAKENYDRALMGESHTNVRVFGEFERAYYESFFNPVRNDKDEIVGATGLARDITERKRIENALIESEARLSIAQSVAHVGSWELDILTHALWWSDETYRVFGFQKGEFAGTMEAFFACVHPDDRPLMNAVTQAAWNRSKPFDVEHRIVRPDGTERMVHEMAEVVFDDAGQPVRMIGTCTDITERKRAEDAVRKSLAEKEVLLREIHHRVKNNMQVVASLMSLQSATIKNEDARLALRESEMRIQLIAGLHQALYESPGLASIHLTHFLPKAVELLRKTYGLTGITILNGVEDIAIEIDRAIPCGLIVNELVTNAFKHALSPGGRDELCFFMKRDGNEYELGVSNTGKSLPPGFSMDHAGSLGLRLVQLLTRQLRGKVTFESGEKTVFTVRFPV